MGGGLGMISSAISFAFASPFTSSMCTQLACPVCFVHAAALVLYYIVCSVFQLMKDRDVPSRS
jgi:hypothetical protein